MNSNLGMPLMTTLYNRLSITNTQETINDRLSKEYSKDLKDREHLISKFETISNDLIKMGFPPKLILHSFLVHKYQTVEEGLEYISRDNEGIWNHQFILGNDDKCFICDSYENNHRSLFINRQHTKNIEIDIEKLMKRRNSNLGQEHKTINIKPCPICFLEIEGEKFNLNCQHEFCKDCIIEYLKEEIKNARVVNITCPNKSCDEQFNEKIIKDLLPQDYIYKYQKFNLREKIKNDSSLIVCPILDCEGFAKNIQNNEINIVSEKIDSNDDIIINIEKNEISNIKLTCNNGHNFCSNCNQAWHYNTSCDIDKEIKEFATVSGYIVKKCINCKVWTEKNEGCNHMTCKICNFNWCWLCELECLADHYTKPGPCYGKQFNNQDDNNMQIMNIIYNDSIFMQIFFVFIFTFHLVDVIVINAHRANNTPNKCGILTGVLILNLFLLFLFIISNGFIILNIMINIIKMNEVRVMCAQCLSIFTYLILYFALFFNGLVLSVLWYFVVNIYSFYKIIFYRRPVNNELIQ